MRANGGAFTMHHIKNTRWEASGGNEHTYGSVYATSLSVLALAVEYLYLPIYQK